MQNFAECDKKDELMAVSGWPWRFLARGLCRRRAMNFKHFLWGAGLYLLSAYPAQAQPRGIDGVPFTKVPGVVISVGQSGDARVPLVRAAVAHWNQLLARIGSGFRLGPVSLGGNGSAQPGMIVVVLSGGEFISHVNRSPGGQ